MSTYEKPQSPLYSKENDAYFYPLTTVDQVIMPDGSRLNTVDLQRQCYAYNLLDNSDFTQWIAQAGLCQSHAGSVEIYAGDRWILDNGMLTGNAREDGNGYTNITLNGTIRQKVANAPDVGTATIEMVSGTADISYANGAITITSNGGVIKNVRLFEGVYTATNLPAYQPKGYTAEFTACRYYYFHIRSIHSFATFGTAWVKTKTQTDAYIPVMPMRIETPTIITGGAIEIQIAGIGSVSVSSIEFDQVSSNILRVKVTTDTHSGTAGSIANLRAGDDVNAFIALSADL